MSNDDIRRLLLEARVAIDDLETVVKDMQRRARRRELGPALHKRHAREAYRKLIHIIDLLLRALGEGNPPAPLAGEGGSTKH